MIKREIPYDDTAHIMDEYEYECCTCCKSVRVIEGFYRAG